MWWKLAGLILGTTLLIFFVIPIRTHAVRIDLANPPSPQLLLPPPLSSIYLTPGTAIAIGFILLTAVLVGVRIVR